MTKQRETLKLANYSVILINHNVTTYMCTYHHLIEYCNIKTCHRGRNRGAGGAIAPPTLQNRGFSPPTMTQERLNHAMTLNIHKGRTDELNITDIAQQFISFKMKDGCTHLVHFINTYMYVYYFINMFSPPNFKSVPTLMSKTKILLPFY